MPALSTRVTDTLPANLVYVGASGSPTHPSAQTVVWNAGTVATSWSALITTTVLSPNGCTVADTTNSYIATWGCADGCRQQATAQATLRTRPVFGTPSVVTNLSPANLNQCGGVITITLTNDGPPAYGVTLTDTVPAGFVYSDTRSATTAPAGYPSSGSNPAVWTWATLPTGQTRLVFRVRNSVAGGSCSVPSGSNVVNLRYDDKIPDCPGTGPYTASATTAITVLRPTLTVDKSPATRTADVGQRITWTLTLNNTGAGTAYNVVVTDVVGSNYSSVQATNGTGGTVPVIAGNRVVWKPSPLAPSGSWTAQVGAVLVSAGSNENVVTATASCDTGCLASRATDISYVTLLNKFDKGPAVQTDTIGSQVVFTFTGSLPDTDALYQSMRLTDTLPTGLGYLSALITYTVDGDGSSGVPPTVAGVAPTSAPAPQASGNIIWALGNLSGTVQFNGKVNAIIQNVASNYVGVRITNTLQMGYTDDGQPYRYQDTANVDILEPLLHLGKSYVTPTGCSATLLQDNFNFNTALNPASIGNWTRVTNNIQATQGVLRLWNNGDVSNATALTDFSLSYMARRNPPTTAATAGLLPRRLRGY